MPGILYQAQSTAALKQEMITIPLSQAIISAQNHNREQKTQHSFLKDHYQSITGSTAPPRGAIAH